MGEHRTSPELVVSGATLRATTGQAPTSRVPEPNFANRTIWTGDCLDIMRGMNAETVDLIYLDPPFNSKRDYAAPIGSQAAGAAFKDTWTLGEIDVEWINLIEAKHPALHRVLLAAMTDSDKAYLAYMAARLLEMPRLLKPTGSVYLHCDPTMSHYLKLVMDAVFGKPQFRNEVVWRYKKFQKAEMRYFTRNSDRLMFYVRSPEADSHFRPVFTKLKKPKRFLKRVWDRETKRIVNAKDSAGRVQYITVNEEKVDDTWDLPYLMPASKERLGYPTQKPLALLNRIIEASSSPGDTVFDPFCGCATACVAADLLDRKWVGVDISPKAVELVNLRLQEQPPLGIGPMFHHGYVAVRDDIPQRTDLGPLPAPSAHRNTLYGLQAGNCAGCATHFELRHLEVDHIIARAKGGTDHIENLQLLCGSCNRIKGDRGMEYLRAKLQLH